ncbi:MAG: hypothetical protein FWF72_01370 [Paludibacter sp.]|nr:hypothetical protein [Paludibacter sp.]
MKEKIELYKMRNFSEMLGDTFSFLRQNFKPLLKGLFFIASPALLLAMIAGFLFWKNYLSLIVTDSVGRYGGSLGARVSGGMILFYLTAIISVTLIMNVTYSYIKLYREDKEREITVSMLWQESKKYFWKIIGALFIIILAVIAFIILFTFVTMSLGSVIGYTFLFAFLIIIICILLVIFLGVKFAFFPLFIIVGDESIRDSFSGSYNFTRGIFWKTLGFVFVIVLIVGAASYIFLIPGYVLIFAGTITGLSSGMESASFLMLLSSAVMSIGMACAYMLYSVLFIGISIFYFSEIEKEQGVRANKEIDEIGKLND